MQFVCPKNNVFQYDILISRYIFKHKEKTEQKPFKKSVHISAVATFYFAITQLNYIELKDPILSICCLFCSFYSANSSLGYNQQ